MPRPFLVLLLLLVMTFGLASGLQPGFAEMRREGKGSKDLVTAVFGESRRMFARYLFAKSDAYLHSGYYPSIFDQRDKDRGAAVAGSGSSHSCDFLSPPRDWIERFGRNFFPSEHRHLGEGTDDHGDHEGHCDGQGAEHERGECEHGARKGGEEREMLPWFQLAADLDPERPETYLVAAYWLRSHLKKVDEAQQFVREGLRANPGNPALLFELGMIYREDRQQPERARNLWELALARWVELPKEEQESQVLLHAQLLGNLAKLEEESGNPAVAINYLERLMKISPHRKQIQAWIEELRP